MVHPPHTHPLARSLALALYQSYLFIYLLIPLFLLSIDLSLSLSSLFPVPQTTDSVPSGSARASLPTSLSYLLSQRLSLIFSLRERESGSYLLSQRLPRSDASARRRCRQPRVAARHSPDHVPSPSRDHVPSPSPDHFPLPHLTKHVPPPLTFPRPLSLRRALGPLRGPPAALPVPPAPPAGGPPPRP